MRKLIILKSLVDFVWIVTCVPAVALLLFFGVYIFVNPETISFVFDNDLNADSSMPLAQFFTLTIIAMIGIAIYCFYLFRITLRYFQKVKPFHDEVIINYNRIGLLLTITGVLSAIIFFSARLVLFDEFRLDFGFTPNVMLICLGLFFMVLSEVFKVAKQAKEENELTV
ncbi:DUF2975 domain-containing protein [uncultured Winogradskyella sp.]|uniref:DUF2975 domain-containing protein n=1 Tax=uncultured Winogradskyella sp. TaxID=395353 RepID=UPI002627CABF|nr:DUF2975 domain-containing protein [uncultured Winogradskyella sp.]